jgi:TPR repeat protein
MRNAAYYLKLAADQGIAAAQFNYGMCLQDGEGVSIDMRNAAYYFKLAADQGYAAAQYNYGICLQNGKGVSIDMRNAAYYFKLAADQGDAAAQNNYGMCLQNGKGDSIDLRSAVYYLKLAADQGIAVAQNNYGMCLHDGKGVSIDLRSAVYYFKLAADQGNAVAQFNYGMCLHDGKGVSIDTRSAVYHFRLATDQGIAVAQFNSGMCLQNGERASIDIRAGAHHLNLLPVKDMQKLSITTECVSWLVTVCRGVSREPFDRSKSLPRLAVLMLNSSLNGWRGMVSEDLSIFWSLCNIMNNQPNNILLERCNMVGVYTLEEVFQSISLQRQSFSRKQPTQMMRMGQTTSVVHLSEVKASRQTFTKPFIIIIKQRRSRIEMECTTLDVAWNTAKGLTKTLFVQRNTIVYLRN